MVVQNDATYGKPSSDNYLIGRGKLMIDLFDVTTGLPTKRFINLGNCTNFALSIAEETLEHRSSQSGLKTIDASITLSKDMTGSFTLDEVTEDNMALFTSGTRTEVAQASETLTDLVLTIGTAGALGGTWFQVKNASGTRVYDLSGFSLKKGSDNSALVLGTDYEVDLAMGMVFVIANGAIDDTNETTVKVTATVPAKTINTVSLLNKTVQRGMLVFLGENANTGARYEVQLNRAKLAADGDLALISDEFASMNLTLTAEKDANGNVGTIKRSYASIVAP